MVAAEDLCCNFQRTVRVLLSVRTAAALAEIAGRGALLDAFPTVGSLTAAVEAAASPGRRLPGPPAALFCDSACAVRVAAAALYILRCWQAATDAIAARADELRRLVAGVMRELDAYGVVDEACVTSFACLVAAVLGRFDPGHNMGVVRDGCNLLLGTLLADPFQYDSNGRLVRAPRTWPGSTPSLFVRVQQRILDVMTGFERRSRNGRRPLPQHGPPNVEPGAIHGGEPVAVLPPQPVQPLGLEDPIQAQHLAAYTHNGAYERLADAGVGDAAFTDEDYRAFEWLADLSEDEFEAFLRAHDY